MPSARWMLVVRGAGPVRPWAEQMRARIPALLDATSGRLVLTLTEEPPPTFAIIPFRRRPVAVVSGDDEAGPEPLLARLEGLGASSAYAVETAYPVAYDKHWLDGEPTPSPMLLTLLRRRRGLSDAEYLRRWHEIHTPHSLAIHPLWHYERNVVTASLTPDSEPCDGIVAEACFTRADLLVPTRFWGGVSSMLPNMARELADTLGFLDLGRTGAYLATERVLRS